MKNASSKSPFDNWKTISWKEVELKLFKLQKRIYRASLRKDYKLVRKLQKLITNSWYAKLLSVRRVTQENKGKHTAGVDGIKSLNPKERLELARKLKINGNSRPTRRVWIPKPGKEEKRPLGIPTIEDRAKQMLLKLALEPEWEATFEPNSYGFRPGRSCHDAIQGIYKNINKKPRFVLDADISKCFDKINHSELLKKLNTKPSYTRQIKVWLKAGVIDFSKWAERKGYSKTNEGTPQGGVISPLLANIALHGMELKLKESFPSDNRGRLRNCKKLYGKNDLLEPRLIRYADDFVILSENLNVLLRSKEIIEEFLSEIGLELKPSKTRLTHTLEEYGEEKSGFDFLGFNIKQFKVGKHHSGKDPRKNLLGFKTIVQPSKDKIKAHYQKLKDNLDKMKAVEQAAVIKHLNPIIRGWCNYQSPWHSSAAYSKVKNLLWNRLWRWAKRRHPNKGRKWIARKYFLLDTEGWRFATRREGKNPLRLLKHSDFPASAEYIKIEGNRSPFDGDKNYWSKRMGQRYSTHDPQKSRLIKRQKGKCAYCGLSFRPDDVVEKHHLESKSSGGKNTDNNLVLLHLHCHDQIEAQLRIDNDGVLTEKLKRNAKISSRKSKQSKCLGNKKKSGRSQAKVTTQSCTKERSEVKVSRSVLKPSQGGDPLA